jgi:enamine deaminase RidA (YjgF/YER057c/UK114 family)
MEIEKKLREMGLELPPAPVPGGNYVETVRTGNFLFVAGHVPRMPDGSLLHPGKLGREVTVEQGYQAAQRTALNCLSSVKAAIGDLDKVKRFIKLLCMVNSADRFGDQPKVANGASDLLVKLYGDRGRHTRSAVGMGGLPNNCCIEIEMMLEVEG